MGIQPETRMKVGLGLGAFLVAPAVLATTSWSSRVEAQAAQQQEVFQRDPTGMCLGERSPTGSIIYGGETEGGREHPDAVVNNAPMRGRWFGPNARSNWHCHRSGQILMVKNGVGRVQKRGHRMRELYVGETEYAGPLVEHWHGAAPYSEVHFLSINFRPGGDLWMEQVSEADYHGNDLGIQSRQDFIAKR